MLLQARLNQIKLLFLFRHSEILKVTFPCFLISISYTVTLHYVDMTYIGIDKHLGANI